MKHRILITTVALCLTITGCSPRMATQEQYQEKTVLTVNGEPISDQEIENTTNRYKNNDLTEDEIIEGMILEAVTLQQADRFDVSISQEKVNERFSELANYENDLYYKKAVEQYGTDEAIKQALYYKLEFDEIEEKVKAGFSDIITISNGILRERSEDYAEQFTDADYENNGISKSTFISEVFFVYYEQQNKVLKDLYFKVWKYCMASNSQISVEGDRYKELFKTDSYEIDEENLMFRGQKYVLDEIDYNSLVERFGYYFYLSPSVETEYGEITGKGVHISEKDIQGAYITIGNENPIVVRIIVCPRLALYNNFTDIMDVIEDDSGTKTVEYFEAELGIYYSVSADMDVVDLEDFLYSHIPYSA